MKFTINVDCISKEARKFIGLPDVAPMQERLVEALEKRMRGNVEKLDSETLIRTWLPVTIQGVSEPQRVFWKQMSAAQPQRSKD